LHLHYSYTHSLTHSFFDSLYHCHHCCRAEYLSAAAGSRFPPVDPAAFEFRFEAQAAASAAGERALLKSLKTLILR
jgi:hypothetical protein